MARTTRGRRKKTEEVKGQEVVETQETTEAEEETTETKDKVEDKSVEEPTEKKESTKIELDVHTPEYVESVLTNAKTLDELFEGLLVSDLTRSLVARLKDYYTSMKSGVPVNEQRAIAANYDLYNALVGVANTDDYGKFSLLFKVVNKVFLLGKDDAFNPIKLSRFDYLWRWGTSSKQNYERLVELVTTLANPANRKLVGKTVSVEKAVEGLPPVAKQNITRFYS